MVRLGMSGDFFHALGHAVAAVGIVGTGLGIVVDDAVAFEEFQHVADIFFLVVVAAYDEQLGIGPGHTFKWVVRVQGGENPTVAVGGRQYVGLEGCEHFGMDAQAPPYRHAVPVQAVPFVFDGPFSGATRSSSSSSRTL